MSRSGPKRHRITIQQKSVTRTASGAESVSWTEFDTLWASAIPLGGRELELAKQIHDEANYKFRIRYRSGLVPEMRISWDSRTFDIMNVQNINERDVEMTLTCREIT